MSKRPQEEVWIIPPRKSLMARLKHYANLFLGRVPLDPQDDAVEPLLHELDELASPMRFFPTNVQDFERLDSWVDKVLKRSLFSSPNQRGRQGGYLLDDDDDDNDEMDAPIGNTPYQTTLTDKNENSLLPNTTSETETCLVSFYRHDAQNGPNSQDFENRLASIHEALLEALNQLPDQPPEKLTSIREKAEELYLTQRAKISALDRAQQERVYPERAYQVPINNMVDRFWYWLAKRKPNKPWFETWKRLREAAQNTYQQTAEDSATFARVQAATVICADYLAGVVKVAQRQDVPLTVAAVQKAEADVVMERGMPAVVNVYSVDKSDQKYVSCTQPMGRKTTPSTQRRTSGNPVNAHRAEFGLLNKRGEFSPVIDFYRSGSLPPIQLKSLAEQQVGATQALEALLKQMIVDLYVSNPDQFLNYLRQGRPVRLSLLSLLTNLRRYAKWAVTQAEGYNDSTQIAMTVQAIAQATKDFDLAEVLREYAILPPAEAFPCIHFDINCMSWPTNPMSIRGIGLKDFDNLNEEGIRQYVRWVVEYLRELQDEKDEENEEITDVSKEIEAYLTRMVQRGQQAQFITQSDINKFDAWLAKDGLLGDYIHSERFAAGTKQREWINFLQLTVEALQAYAEGPELACVRDLDFQSRFVITNRMMGVLVDFFCKSGKDRTGLLAETIEKMFIQRHQSEVGAFPLRRIPHAMVVDRNGEQRFTEQAITDIELTKKVRLFSSSQEICGLNVPGARALQRQRVMWPNMPCSAAEQQLARLAKYPYEQAQKRWGLRWLKLTGQLMAPIGWLAQYVHPVRWSRQLWDAAAQFFHSRQKPAQYGYDELMSATTDDDPVGDEHKHDGEPVRDTDSLDRRQPSIPPRPNKPVEKVVQVAKSIDTDPASSAEYRKPASRSASLSSSNLFPVGKPPSPSSTSSATEHPPSEPTVVLTSASVPTAVKFITKAETYTQWENKLGDVCKGINQRYLKQNRETVDSQPQETVVVSMRKDERRVTLWIADLFQQQTPPSVYAETPQVTEQPSVNTDWHRKALVDLWVLTLLTNRVVPNQDGVYQASGAQPPSLNLVIGKGFKGRETLDNTLAVALGVYQFLNDENKRHCKKGEQVVPVELKITDQRVQNQWKHSQDPEQTTKLMSQNASEVAEQEDKDLQKMIRAAFQNFSSAKTKADDEMPAVEPSSRLSL